MIREENALSVRFVDVPQTSVDEICHWHEQQAVSPPQNDGVCVSCTTYIWHL